MFVDESGFSLVSPIKLTWATRGRTPSQRTSLQDHERFNLQGALCLAADNEAIKLHVQSHGNHLTGEDTLAIVNHLLRQLDGPIVLVRDNHPIHKRVKVRDFLAEQSRLHLYWIPIYAPELNPEEFVWN